MCCEEFHAQDFPKSELEKCLSGLSDYLKLTFYCFLKESIEKNSTNNIRLINNDMNQMGFYLKDFNPNSYVNDWLKGQRYVPLLFLALEHHSISSIQCLVKLGLPLTGRMYTSKSINNTNSRCVSFRTRAEELECFDIIGMINDLEDDDELKNIFKKHQQSPETIHHQSAIVSAQQSKRRRFPQHESNIRKQNTDVNNVRSETCSLL